MTSLESGLPPLRAIAPDLLTVTRVRTCVALCRPPLALALYAVAAARGAWPAAIAALFLVFTSVIAAMHDAVHGTLGLRRRPNDVALFAFGALLLVSGHAYRATHHQHHRVFPGDDDPEGLAARMTPLRALLDGPLHVARIWLWAFRRAGRRRWLYVEAAALPVAVAGAIVSLHWTPVVAVYVALVVAGGWLYPLLTVTLPHRHPGDEPLSQAHTLRGRILPALLLEQTYHLEHHLYPRVPSYNLPRLAHRLDPYFEAAGIRPRRVP